VDGQQFSESPNPIVLYKPKNQIQQVILHGGLGNQLFQWSYGHQLAFKGQDVRFNFYKRPYILEHTSTSLGEFLPDCSHCSFTEIELPKSRIGRVLLDPLHERNVFSKVWGRVIDTSSNPFVHPLPTYSRKQGIHFGYFQTFESPMAAEEILLKELWITLEGRVRTPLEMELEGAEVIHVRQGDTLTKSNMKKVGVLSSEYYSQIPRLSLKRRIILTDDVKGASKVLPQVHIDDIYGPSDFDVYQTLGVMARAHSLYTANSTLSWWGGFLARSRGAEVHIPHPFFREYSPDPELSFAYPDFQLLNARFMEVSD
jgi:hypothetical protein